MNPRLVILIALASVGCKNRLVATVDGVLLADCDGTIEPIANATRASMLVTSESTDTSIVSKPGALALVIDRGVLWPRVKSVVDRLTKEGAAPQLLCGKVSDVRAFQLQDTLSGEPTIQMVVEPKGKFCVQTPEVPQAFCVQGSLGHIPRADVRQTIRETMKKWSRTDVEVTIDLAVEWADVVRAIDGARTCCGNTAIRVALKQPGAKPVEIPVPQ
jgi:hypothetical protein